MKPYNYTQFKADYYSVPEFHGPQAGEYYYEMEVYDVRGKRRRLSDFLGRRPVVIETASLTNPSYVNALPHMHKLQMQYPEVIFLVLYVREAHPGRQMPAHSSLGNKLIAAQQLASQYNEKRTILVDDLEGTAHQKYGKLPNMVYVFNPNGKVAFRGDWNQPGHLAYVLKGLQKGRQVFRRDFFAPPKPRVQSVIKALVTGGMDAFWQFIKSLPQLTKLCRLSELSYQHRLLHQSVKKSALPA